jgi:hypothetical protein
MRWFSLTVVCVCVFLLDAKTQLAKAADAQEPTYRGKTLDQWKKQAKEGDAKEKSIAAESLGTFGPEAIVALTDMLRE